MVFEELGKITINTKNKQITFDSEFERNFNNSISRIDDYLIIKIENKIE